MADPRPEHRLAWLTDIHLDFLDEEGITRLGEMVLKADPEAVLLGGDITRAPLLRDHLLELEHAIKRPIYFVLGNHDYYGQSVEAVRTEIRQICRERRLLNWLPAAGVIRISERVAVVGHGGWGDARLGDWFLSDVSMNDYRLITDLADLDPLQLQQKLNELGDDAAKSLRLRLKDACSRFEGVIVLTHVPPFPEACYHEGVRGSVNQLPHFCCGSTGQVLREMREEFPDVRFWVLAGHTHEPIRVKIDSHMEVLVGVAAYGRPVLQGTLIVT